MSPALCCAMTDLALSAAPKAIAPAIALEAARTAFFARFDAFCASYCPRASARLRKPVTPSKVSRKLFGSPRRVADLRAGADIGVLRLAEAERDLAAWAEQESISLSLDDGRP